MQDIHSNDKTIDWDAIEIHELANLFPAMSAQEYSGLVDSIRCNGLREKPTVWYAYGKHQLIDGRDRCRAAIEVDAEPEFEVFKGSYAEAEEFVWDKNARRRNLQPGQLALVAARSATSAAQRPKSDGIPRVTPEAAAKRAGISVDSVKQAIKVLKDGSPVVISALQRGEITLDAAVNRVKAELKLPSALPPVKPVAAASTSCASDPGPTDTNNSDVHPTAVALTPVEQTDDFVEDGHELELPGMAGEGQFNAVADALAQDPPDIQSAVAALEALINDVNAQSLKKISVQDADDLTVAAQTLIDELG